MSFFTNNNNGERCPGRITGNALSGLCERTVIQTDKVFDACIRQTQIDNVVLTVTNATPAGPAEPLTFVSARSSFTEQTTVTVTSVTPIADRPNFGRVQATVTVPMEVVYTDANGVRGVGQSSFSFNVDIVMYIPDPSIIPYTITGVASVVAPDGEYTGDMTFNVTCCVTLIMKVIMRVDLLVPSYGYATLPPCQEYTQDACSGFFDLPIFPDNG